MLKVAKNIFWVVTSCVYAVLFLEIFMRIVAPQTIEPRYITGAPWGVRRNIPGASYHQTTPESFAHVRINSEGMRSDREYSVAKPAGYCRIEVFGDSFLMGFEVDQNQDFSKQLELDLSKMGYRVEVLNFAVSGFGQAEMLKTLTGYSAQFNPDVVISSWHRTDIDDNARSELYRIVNGKLETYKDTYLPFVKVQDKLNKIPLYNFISDNSHLYAYLREKAGMMGKQQMAATAEHSMAAKSANGEEGDSSGSESEAVKTLSEEILRLFRDTVTARGARFVVLEIPSRIDRSTYDSVFDQLPRPFWKEFDTVSPLATFRAMAKDRPEIYYEKGGARHFTPLGHRIVAALMARHLVDTGALKACAPRTQGTGHKA